MANGDRCTDHRRPHGEVAARRARPHRGRHRSRCGRPGGHPHRRPEVWLRPVVVRRGGLRHEGGARRGGRPLHARDRPDDLRGLVEPGPVDHLLLRSLHRDLGLRLRRRRDGGHGPAAAHALPVLLGPGVGHSLRPGRPGPRLVGALLDVREGLRRARRADVRQHDRRGRAHRAEPARTADGAGAHHPHRLGRQRAVGGGWGRAARSRSRPTATGSARRAGPPRGTCA